MNLKKTLFTKAPSLWKPNLSYLNYRMGSRFDMDKNMNMVKCVLGKIGKTINYVPPVFAVCVSMKCNLRCPTCYYLLQSDSNLDDGGFMKPVDFSNMLDKYAPFMEVCGLSGGEALMNPDIGEIISIANKKGVRVNLNTNGILIRDRIQVLCDNPMNSISISMDSYDYESFNVARGGTRKQFDSIIDGLHLLNMYGIDFILSFVLTSVNIKDIDKMLSFSHRFKPKVASFMNINPHGDNRYSALTTDNSLPFLLEVIKRDDYSFNIELPVIFDTYSKGFNSAKCSLPWQYCVVDHNGNIAPCCQLMHDVDIGNIFNGYDFNSARIQFFREAILGKDIPAPCIYCYRRFMGDEFGVFDSKAGKWILK